jgi:lysophospholipase L1-like esterase
MNRRSILIGLAKATLLLFSLGLSLLVAEVAMRVAGYEAIYEVYSKPSILWQHDALLGWSHEPGAKGRYVGPRPWPVEFESPVSINSLGLRGPEVEPIPDEGVRILVLGDSMVAGFEVRQEETFIAVLESMLTQELPFPVQAINAGVRGYGTDQTYLYFRERGRLLEPDLVLMWLSSNDLLNDITIHRMRRIFGKAAFVPDGDTGLRLIGAPVPDYPECSEFRTSPDGQIERLDSPFGRVLCRLQMTLFDRSALFSFLTHLLPWDQWGNLLRDLYHLGMPQGSSSPGGADGPGEDESEPVTARIIAELSRAVEAEGARFILISEPEVFDRFEGAGVDVGRYTQIRLDRISAADRAEVRFVHDSHLNAKGHRIVAGELRDALVPVLQAMRAGR